MTVVVELALPKVNLTLTVRGRRSDGYHDLASLVAFATAPADRIQLDTSSPPDITVTGPFADAIAGENLLQRVLDLVAPHLGGHSPGSVVLEKVLPVAAGIGGGSADAAALLRALLRAFPQAATQLDWPALALRLGADVPVCLTGSTTWMTGIGETLMPVTGFPRLEAVLVNPRASVPADKTARVFRALAAPLIDSNAAAPAMPRVLGSPATQIKELTRFANDLTAAARSVMPVIADVLATLQDCEGCRLTRLSGAGPTAFGLFETPEAAAESAHRIRRDRPSWWVIATSLGGD